ncbi:YitT family protein [Bacillus sp. FJAT-29790]|uniref:YczE/YyaS/YitT family protein n=1 Tax=Bacillus sp. FJAT-29790 TaxID=1895002 RepID=UPI001C236F32|nr:YitT family protein [Bacillus sp. FJAT-29790]MBU8879505.1 YitT family protein [Bacillus sp. FJAT-29790]
MITRKSGQIRPRIVVYLMGLLIMSLGIVLLIKADLGATPWDVLHVGLYYQLGLTIGSWSVLVGFVIIGVACLISKELPRVGSFTNMILIGLFIDLYLLLPFMQTPSALIGKMIMFVFGIIIYCYGMGIYISAQFGAGPRDSLMIALTEKTGWNVGRVRACMEIVVLIIGWQLGGPVFWGTIVISVTMGSIVGVALPQCQSLTDWFLQRMKKQDTIIISNLANEKDRGVN